MIRPLRQINATEYIAPLREGGSLPAIVRADDGAIYAMKFFGAGQGEKALIAELISGEIARYLGFNVPEITLIELDPSIGHTEPDAEIQDLLHASAGMNLGMAFLTHSTTFSLMMPLPPSEAFASRLVWFDAFVTNMDRTPRNVNMLIHQGDIWLIDHGASLYFQHNWQDTIQHSKMPFPMIRDHVLLPLAADLEGANRFFLEALSREVFERIVAQVPDAWLHANERFEDAAVLRAAYVDFLINRLVNADIFVKEARDARALRV